MDTVTNLTYASNQSFLVSISYESIYESIDVPLIVTVAYVCIALPVIYLLWTGGLCGYTWTKITRESINQCVGSVIPAHILDRISC